MVNLPLRKTSPLHCLMGVWLPALELEVMWTTWLAVLGVAAGALVPPPCQACDPSQEALVGEDPRRAVAPSLGEDGQICLAYYRHR